MNLFLDYLRYTFVDHGLRTLAVFVCLLVVGWFLRMVLKQL